ncbi:neuropeptides B/W receptor type like protein [Tanacetum coccineum]
MSEIRPLFIGCEASEAFNSFDLMESAAHYGEVRRFWGLDEKCGVLEEAKCALVIWFLPCLILKIAREGVRMMFTFINGGDFASKAKISHRAQGIAALASRWHALASYEIFTYDQWDYG